jgi:hypothetical protein
MQSPEQQPPQDTSRISISSLLNPGEKLTVSPHSDTPHEPADTAPTVTSESQKRKNNMQEEESISWNRKKKDAWYHIKKKNNANNAENINIEEWSKQYDQKRSDNEQRRKVDVRQDKDKHNMTKEEKKSIDWDSWNRKKKGCMVL